MSADLFALRDFVERSFLAFDIPYQYLFGEVMEAEVPPTYQPLFGGQSSLKLSFSDVAILDPSIERVTHGALVLDALGRLLEGDRNTFGLAVVARRIDFGAGIPEFKDRLSVLNAKVISTVATIVHRPIVRLEFQLRAVTAAGLRSQSVPVFYDVETDRILDGSRYATIRVHDVEEIPSGHDVVGLRIPPAETLAAAARAAVNHLQRLLPPLPPGRDGEPPVVDLRLARMLILHDPRAGVQITYKERSTQREFALSFPTGEDPGHIAPPFCPQCGRIKTHYYISHRTGRLICTDCSLLCVGCWDAYALAGKNCALCNKRRYCPACLRECDGCAIAICPDHATACAETGRVRCPNCPPPEREPPEEEEKKEEEAPPERVAPAALAAAPLPPLTEDVFAEAAAPPSPSDDLAGSSRPAGAAVDDDEEDIFVGTDWPEPADATPAEAAPDDDPFWSTPGAAASPAADDADIFGELPPEPAGDAPPEPAEEAAWPDDENASREQAELPPARVERAARRPARPERFEPVEDADDIAVPKPFVSEPAERENRRREAPELELALDDATDDGCEAETASSPFQTCTCHGYRRNVDSLRMDFLSGRYYCPEEVALCSNCGQASALDFLDGDPPLCFYCANRMPLNLDPEGEEIFRREVQPVIPFKYRLSSCRIARSPHHLAFYIKPLVGREIILYWDRWTDTLLDDDQFA
ncbi:MAG: hypothetical protein JXQ29_11700 [Planctomycetes bacterium]|nr:hypothetical protein [Planctomycetota bacterium]